jgi:hypothetical protein
MDLGHWTLADGVSLSADTFGFVYSVFCTVNQRYYIGKKQCHSRIKRKPLKGKTRNRIDSKDSSWREYTGSSNDLNADIEKYGKDKFIFTILKTCRSKWELSYDELQEQLKRNVIKDPLSYNGILHIRLGKIPQKLLN